MEFRCTLRSPSVAPPAVISTPLPSRSILTKRARLHTDQPPGSSTEIVPLGKGLKCAIPNVENHTGYSKCFVKCRPSGNMPSRPAGSEEADVLRTMSTICRDSNRSYQKEVSQYEEYIVTALVFAGTSVAGAYSVLCRAARS